MVTFNPSASVSGFSDGQAPSYNKIPMKERITYKKTKGFPPARKTKFKQLGRPDVWPATPPDHPQILL